MISKPRTDLFIDRGNGDLAKIASFREYREYEMVLRFSGMSSDNASLAYQYEDRVITQEGMNQFRTSYAEAKATNLSVDHFTVHCERGKFKTGEFHLRVDYGSKPVHKVPIPPPLNELSPKFLDFVILTDVISKYATSNDKPDSADIIFDAGPKDIVTLRVRFSGVDFDLEGIIAAEEFLLGKQIVGAVMLPGKTLKGGITVEIKTLSAEVLAKRPTGTFVVMRFPSDDNSFLVKTFVFS